ncbi:MAG TPA: hypothetical protein VEX39_11625 [Thermoleophilaceae bacterium]|nr:hypothetical protein [Thermoleophilaceae bacterium]
MTDHDDPQAERLLRKLLSGLATQTDPKEAALAEVGLEPKYHRLLDGETHEELVANARKLAGQLNLPQTEQRFTEAEVLDAGRLKNDDLNALFHPDVRGDRNA